MIKATELRIGNKVLYNNRIVKVLSIHKTGEVFVNQEGPVHLKDIHPIDLNRDMLLRYGFTEVQNGIYTYNYRELTEIFNTMNEFFFRYDGKFIASCKYLHELQNIFFSLYKEEIKITRFALWIN
jgi:hypothetical protein